MSPLPKIVWVALPLLLALLVLAVLLARRRVPSRHAVNIVASLLLLGYLAATAGLGIFWVANQQLPVFDWHYLFGYGTLLLVALHLVFNLPRVWRFFATRSGGAGRPLASRRGALAMLGAAAAAGLAFFFGWRQRGGETRHALPAAVGPAGGAQSSALAAVERYHALSSHSRAGVLLRAPGVDWGDPPPPFKAAAGTKRWPLPPPGGGRGSGFDAGALADVLWHTVGITETRGGLALRASPSSGGLFSTELYVVLRSLPGLPAGLGHYDPRSNSIEALPGTLPPAAGDDDGWRDAPVLVVATAVFRRTGHKYRDRSYRYVLADLGHALENLRVAALARGLHAEFAEAFDESRIARALGVDEADEGVLALVALRPAAAGGLPPAARRTFTPAPAVDAAPLGATAAVHAATSLRAPPRPAPAGGAVRLPQVDAVRADGLRVIAARRSVRRHAAAPLPLATLAAILDRMNASGALLSPALRIDVVALAVDGLAAGAWRHDPAARMLVPRRTAPDLRRAARAAALDQDVVGTAAAVFVLAIDRLVFAADPLGAARGYRHAFLEAGMAGERVYLEATARGLAVCGVGAFYDDEAAALVGVDPAREWVVHFAAVGPRS